MEYRELKKWAGFYENELTNRFLSFWIPRCVDAKNGGFVNCFTNDGSRLMCGARGDLSGYSQNWRQPARRFFHGNRGKNFSAWQNMGWIF